jgi:3-oxoacyl-[acyl-carrier protein] reductase
MEESARGSAILITGATGSIGLEIAARTAAEGAVVGVHGSRLESVDGALEKLRRRVPAGQFVPLPADFRENGAIAALVEQFVTDAGRLNGVVDCALGGPAGQITGPFAGTNPQHFEAHAAAALGNLQTLCFAALPHLARQGGSFVAFASDSGRFAAPRQAVVGASMAGIIGFVRNIALEVARDQIRVNCVTPSFVAETAIFERFSRAAEGRAQAASRRAGLGLPRPSDISPLVLFLLGPGSACITGQVISVNGGLNA